MFKKDYKTIDKIFIEERECGHTLCDFGDRQHDLREIADIIGVEMVKNEDGNWVFKNEKQKHRVEKALDYYYSLH